MATIALYATQINQMPTLFKNFKNSVIDYQVELSSLKANVLTIPSSICNMEDVISSIQASTQTQEQKAESIDLLDKNNGEFVQDVIAVDSKVSDVIRRRKEDFYATYAYLKPECEKSWLESMISTMATADAWCREHWKEIVTVILVVAAIAVIIWCPGIALLLAMAKGILMGAAIGGLIGGAMSALGGGSFWEGFANGAFMGAISGMIAGGMSFAFAGEAAVMLTFKQTLLIGGVTGAATPAISDLGDIIIKGEDISLGQLVKDVVIGGVLGVAFAGIGYGIGKAFGALKLKFSNNGGSGVRVFESKDPLVGEVATQIEREFPGSVNGVNRIVHRPDGSILTDLDIELENIVIQVKSGGGKGLTRQLINSANYIKKIVIGYAPEIKPSVLNEAQKNGFQVFTNIADLLEFIGKNLGGL